MKRILASLAALVLLAASAPTFLGITTAVSAPREVTDSDAAATAGKVPLMVVMDISGSISSPTGASVSTTKIEDARRAIIDLVSVLSSDQQFGLISYPGEGRIVNEGCSEGDMTVRLGPADRLATSLAVRQLEPAGDTPTSAAFSMQSIG